MSVQLRELATILAQHNVQNIRQGREIIAQVYNLMSRNVDLSSIEGSIVTLLASPDPLVKKCVCTFIINYASHNSSISLLVSNTLLKDFEDPNPLVRGLVLRTVFTIPDLASQGMHLLQCGLEDSSSYVRRTAVISCCRAWKHSPSAVIESDVVDRLYATIRDPDPIVVVNCLEVLDEILASEGGIVVNRNIAHSLLGRISSFPEWSLVSVLKILNKYEPTSEEELLHLLNVLDPCLSHKLGAVIISTLQLFLNIIRDKFPILQKDVLERILPNLCAYLNSPNDELTFSVLEVFGAFLPQHANIFSKKYKSFLCRFCDSPSVKLKKLALLPMLINDSNSCGIAEELMLYIADANPEISRTAIQSLACIIKLHSPTSAQNLLKLLDAMHIRDDRIAGDVICALDTLDIQVTTEVENYIHQALTFYNKSISSKAQCAFVGLLSKYGTSLTHGPYILEDIIDGLEDGEDPVILSVLLSASVRVFLQRPAEMQDALSKLFEFSLKRNACPLVQDEAWFYYSLLHASPCLAQKVVQKTVDVQDK